MLVQGLTASALHPPPTLTQAIDAIVNKPGTQWSEHLVPSGLMANHPHMLPVVLAALSSLGLVIRIRYRSERGVSRHVQLGRLMRDAKHLYFTIEVSIVRKPCFTTVVLGSLIIYGLSFEHV